MSAVHIANKIMVGMAAAAMANSQTASASASSSSCYCYCYQTTRRTKARARVRAPATTTSSSSSILQLESRFGMGFKLQLQLLGCRRFLSPWTGLLKHLPPHHNSPSFQPHKAKNGKFRGKVVHASLFGVGAPEALVIGVVALLVFGPKGLAEVARNLGKTLRAFQPTIRELQDVSREFKSTLEREIGLDEIAPSTNNTYKPTSFSNENKQSMVDPNGAAKSEAYTSEDLLKITQEQLAASPGGPQALESSTQGQQQDAVEDSPVKVPAASDAQESAAQMQSSDKVDSEG